MAEPSRRRVVPNLFHKLVSVGRTIHLRSFFYLLIGQNIEGPTGNLFVNDEKQWKSVLIASKSARWLGLVPFERIVDARNPESLSFVPDFSETATNADRGQRRSSATSVIGPFPSISTEQGRASVRGQRDRHMMRTKEGGRLKSLPRARSDCGRCELDNPHPCPGPQPPMRRWSAAAAR
jgi:hypothetical protein